MKKRSIIWAVPLLLIGCSGGGQPTTSENALENYASATWASLQAMTGSNGLPADWIELQTRERAAYTSPTNIGAYLWSLVSARELGLIGESETAAQAQKTIAALSRLERHEPTGQFYNWYDPVSGEVLTRWPANNDPVYPFLSSVDNGWLAAALMLVAQAVPEVADSALAIAGSMDFSCYYDPEAGLLRGGFWTSRNAPPNSVDYPRGDYCGGGEEVIYTGHHYGALNTEPRIASYLAMAKDGVPPQHYFHLQRTFPPSCDWGWTETAPEGEWKTYLGVEIFEGHYTYRGLDLVPTWGGSMFEALMPALLVPEAEWGQKSWALNHPRYVQAQIRHGLEEAGYGYWGFSPANNPAGGYREWGVDAIGMEPNGYSSDQERTLVDSGYADPEGGYCPGREPGPAPSDYGEGVVTPHAAFLALEFASKQATANLQALQRDFDIYGWGGFADAVEVKSGRVSPYYLALDQGMVMLAIANYLTDNRIRGYFSEQIEGVVRPILAQDDFGLSD